MLSKNNNSSNGIPIIIIVSILLIFTLYGCVSSSINEPPSSTETNSNTDNSNTDNLEHEQNTTTAIHDSSQTTPKGNTILDLKTSSELMAVLRSDYSLWVDKNYVSHNTTKLLEDVVCFDVFNSTLAAVQSDGSLWLYGDDSYGMTDIKNNSTPLTKIMDNVSLVRLGEVNIAVIKTDGSLWIGGRNEYGQVGNGTIGDPFVNEDMTHIMDDVIDIVFGDGNTIALTSDGSVFTWGSNFAASLGNGTDGDWEPHPYPIKVLDDAIAIYTAGNSGFRHNLIIKNDGSLWAWGGARGAIEEYPYDFYSNGSDAWGRATQTTPLKLMDNVSRVFVSPHYDNVPTFAILLNDNTLFLWGSLIDNTQDITIWGEYMVQSNTVFPVRVMDDVKDCCVLNGCILPVQNNGELWIYGTTRKENLSSTEGFTSLIKDVINIYGTKETVFITKDDLNLYWCNLDYWNGDDFYSYDFD